MIIYSANLVLIGVNWSFLSKRLCDFFKSECLLNLQRSMIFSEKYQQSRILPYFSKWKKVCFYGYSKMSVVVILERFFGILDYNQNY
jgi:hypothetical protein